MVTELKRRYLHVFAISITYFYCNVKILQRQYVKLGTFLSWIGDGIIFIIRTFSMKKK